MDSPQSVISPQKNSQANKPNGNHNNVANKDKSFIGALEVHIHSAREILNICIYHKQDVYAKLSLTDDPENSVNSTIINGGGQNPVFNDTVRLNVARAETSLKCEIWMMSRVRNYLEDQLLGFALVPLSEVLLNDGKLEKREFTLSSTDLFHSPSGFVQLSIEYSGAKPAMVVTDLTREDSDISEALTSPNELDRIEFPDPKIVNEDEIMVSEYMLGNPCTSLDTNSDAGNDNEVEESAETVEAHPQKADSPASVDNGGGVGDSLASDSSSSEEAAKEKGDKSEGESVMMAKKSPAMAIEPPPENKVVQQDIVDMYMKSMQQFTESLAKMKLPLDIIDTTAAGSPANTNSNSSSSPAAAASSATESNSGSDPKAGQTPKSNRVFYGSRAFF